MIERLVEPRPVPAMAERFPDYYETLMREPGFIAFRLRKIRPAHLNLSQTQPPAVGGQMADEHGQRV